MEKLSMRLLSVQDKINSSSVKPSQNRFSLLQKAQFLSFLTFRDLEENPENLSSYANRNSVSRQTLYNLKDKFIHFFSPQKTGPEPKVIQSHLPSKPNSEPEEEYPPFHYFLGNLAKTLSPKVQKKIHCTILEAATSPVSVKKIQSILRAAFSLSISKRKIKLLLNAYSEKAHRIFKNLELELYVENIGLDEVFCGRKPILVGIDLESFAVVLVEKSNTRTHKDWLEVLKPFELVKLVASDEGTGLVKAIKEWKRAHQLDLFHFKREAHKLLRHLESQAYKKIEKEYQLLKKLSKKNGEVVELLEKYELHQVETLKTIELFDLVEKNLKIIFEALDPFDQSGKLQEPSKSLLKIKNASERLKKTTKNKRINKIADKALDKRLLHYLKELNEKLQSVVLRWKKGGKTFSRKKVFEIMGNFFYEKNKRIKVYEKPGESRKELLERRNKLLKKHFDKRFSNGVELQIVSESLSNFEEVYDSVIRAFSEIYRSSSLVESYNSQIRISQQVKKGVSNKNLWLSALKWNVTRFEGGKRAGKSPFEILGVKVKSNDWLELLMNS